jgi:hypothetical protein
MEQTVQYVPVMNKAVPGELLVRDRCLLLQPLVRTRFIADGHRSMPTHYVMPCGKPTIVAKKHSAR